MLYLLILTFLLIPAYIIRFDFLSLPANPLMLWVFFLWLVWAGIIAYQNRWQELWTFFKNFDKKLLIFILLFFFAGLTSLYVKGINQDKLGQFIVLFLQPISLFFIVAFHFNHAPQNKPFILYTLYFILAACGLYAITQYFTLFGLPQAYWGNANEPKRALSFFLHPNFYALWSAPLLALLVPDLILRFRQSFSEGGKIKDLSKNWLLVTAWMLGALGLLLSFSRAGWLGLAAAIGIYLLVAADKKIRKLALVIFIIIFIIILSVPNLRWRFVLPFYGEKSTVSRLSLWHTGSKAIQESPITGLGLTGFSKNWNRLNTDPNLDTHNFPHNIFLNFWVETGLLGLLSFIGLSSLLIYRGIKNRTYIIKLSVALFLIAILFQGLIDSPYLKNDLAMVFWMVLALGS